MRIPAIQGVIERRIRVNYRIDPDVIAHVLPPPFRPKTVRGFAIGGICLIRLKDIRPKFASALSGIQSENAAHRVAVEWDEDGITRDGVFVPRRDTNSRLNTWVGGRLFPGQHHLATFNVEESRDHLAVSLFSDDGKTRVHVRARMVEALSASSVFASMAEASTFFESGSLGYSATTTEGRYEGLELRCKRWAVTPLDVEEVESSYFEDRRRFPSGSVEFDCALLMQDIEHEWLGRAELCCAVNGV